MAAGARRRARWYALQVLYALDLNPGEDAEQALREYFQKFEIEVEERALEFARDLVMATVAHRPALDRIIQEVSRNWRLERMSRVDRNILRLATCELEHARDVPVKVVINEAVELAKRYGTSESPAFVNGILDRIAHSVRGPAS
jgi:transcription antitermination protein NusB